MQQTPRWLARLLGWLIRSIANYPSKGHLLRQELEPPKLVVHGILKHLGIRLLSAAHPPVILYEPVNGSTSSSCLGIVEELWDAWYRDAPGQWSEKMSVPKVKIVYR